MITWICIKKDLERDWMQNKKEGRKKQEKLN